MDSTKLKRLRPRTGLDGRPPAPWERGPTRLASEPTSRHLRLADRWEPGFLRLPGGGAPKALSHVVDGLGIHYDATSPSELEVMLQDGGWEKPGLLARAARGMERLRTLRLSVDNDPRRVTLEAALAGSPAPPDPRRRRGRVVVVDQPRDDPTIGFSLAGPSRFAAMLETARDENPEAEIVVVTDPAAPFGAAPGHLGEAVGARVVHTPVEPWSVVESADRVYVVASHLGLEAAIAGRPVTCCGVPFYSGWGFTDDRLDPPRRTRPRSVEEVFAAAYLLYSRYFDPFTGRAFPFEPAVEVLRLVVERNRENAVATTCVGIAAWKRPWIERTLGTPGNTPRVVESATVSAADLRGTERVIAWSSRPIDGLAETCRAAQLPLARMEDGFLRSVGLGVALRPGASYVLDGRGIYYDSTGPSDLERLLEEAVFDDELLARAAALRTAIVAARLSKYNVGRARLPARPESGPLVLVAGQVEDDASILLGGATVKGNAGLLKRARERNPGAVIAYKPHPDVEAGLRLGHIPGADLMTLADVVFRDVPAADAIDAAERVEVMTSLLGFEALLRGKPVTTHGLPFYAGWGLTDSPPCPRRTRRLTVDELVAGSLILYPRYVDPRTGLACTPEVLVRRFGENDPALSRRERTPEALLKAAWSVAWRGVFRR